MIYLTNILHKNSIHIFLEYCSFLREKHRTLKKLQYETEKHNSIDNGSFTGKLSCLFQGAADTTFYIVALYFGSVGIRKTRYAVTAGLVADTVGAIAAIFIAYYFFR